jgi:hypothetical protein
MSPGLVAVARLCCNGRIELPENMAERVKRIDQHRHELKALRYLLDFDPPRLAAIAPLPQREDFQIPDCRSIYDALMGAPSRAAAEAAIRELDLEETDVASFLRLGGEFYFTYPRLVVERAARFRDHTLELESA